MPLEVFSILLSHEVLSLQGREELFGKDIARGMGSAFGFDSRFELELWLLRRSVWELWFCLSWLIVPAWSSSAYGRWCGRPASQWTIHLNRLDVANDTFFAGAFVPKNQGFLRQDHRDHSNSAEEEVSAQPRWIDEASRPLRFVWPGTRPLAVPASPGWVDCLEGWLSHKFQEGWGLQLHSLGPPTKVCFIYAAITAGSSQGGHEGARAKETWGQGDSAERSGSSAVAVLLWCFEAWPFQARGGECCAKIGAPEAACKASLAQEPAGEGRWTRLQGLPGRMIHKKHCCTVSTMSVQCISPSPGRSSISIYFNYHW